MGASCSKVCYSFDHTSLDNVGPKQKSNPHYYQQNPMQDVHDQKMHQLMKRSLNMYSTRAASDDTERDKDPAPVLSVKRIQNKTKKSSNDNVDVSCGQYHLLFRQQLKGSSHSSCANPATLLGTGSPSSSYDKENALNRGNTLLKESRMCNEEAKRITNHNKQEFTTMNLYPTRLVQRRHPVRSLEEGISGNHIYAIRWPAGKALASGHEGSDEDDNTEQRYLTTQQEQCPKYRISASDRSKSGVPSNFAAQYKATSTQQSQTNDGTSFVQSNPSKMYNTVSGSKSCTATTGTVLSLAADIDDPASTTASVDHLFQPSAMCAPPRQKVRDWVTISAEHNVYVADVGVTPAECDRIVAVTEQVCRGQYAAYTYAKQTLGCREFPELAEVVQSVVHTVTHAILEFSALSSVSGNKHSALALDDREPHMVKYDVTKKERQKLDMHTDKSEWTFLISLSNGCGLDFTGGGTYFECLDSTVHIQRGHALIFPGKLRHCGQRITSGLRFLLVGFLVDKSPTSGPLNTSNATNNSSNNANNNCNNSNGKIQLKDDGIASEPSYITNIP